MSSLNGAGQRYACIALDYEDIKHLFATLNLKQVAPSQAMFEQVADRFLEILDRHGVKATLFVIGEDILKPHNRKGLQRFIDAGHEVANHTLTHPFGMRRLSYAEKEHEIDAAQAILEEATGQRVVGYKAPLHDIDADVIDILEKRGYLYDASVYPSFFNPVLNVFYYFVGGGRPLGLGDWQCSTAPNRPYVLGHPYWRRGSRSLLEFPISQIPGLRFPVYATVLFTAGMASFRASFACVKHTRFLTYVFHSFDLLGENDEGVVSSLRRYPAMRHPLAKRLEMVDQVIGTLARRFKTVTYREAVTSPAIRRAIF